MFSDLVVQFSMLVGVAALIAAVVNVLKTFGLPDGYASRVALALSTLSFVALVGFSIFAPEVSVWAMDENAGWIAEKLLYVLGFFVQIGLPAKFHDFLRTGKVPLVGYSYSDIKYEEEFGDL